MHLHGLDFFEHFTVIDQNSLPSSKSAELINGDFPSDLPVRIVKNLDSPYQHASYQHADAVNKVLKKLNCKCERIWIVDTDLFASPQAIEWLDKAMEKYGAIFMQDPVQALLSHPCLMIVARKNLEIVNLLPTEISLIDPRQTKQRLIDTGRILAAKLSESGISVAIVRRNLERKFNPKIFSSIHQPDFYLDGEIVHFRSMSFSTRSDAKQRLRIMDLVRYYFPRRFVDRYLPLQSKSFSGLFSFFQLRRIYFYLNLIISRKTRLELLKNFSSQ